MQTKKRNKEITYGRYKLNYKLKTNQKNEMLNFSSKSNEKKQIIPFNGE